MMTSVRSCGITGVILLHTRLTIHQPSLMFIYRVVYRVEQLSQTIAKTIKRVATLLCMCLVLKATYQVRMFQDNITQLVLKPL